MPLETISIYNTYLEEIKLTITSEIIAATFDAVSEPTQDRILSHLDALDTQLNQYQNSNNSTIFAKLIPKNWLNILLTSLKACGIGLLCLMLF